MNNKFLAEGFERVENGVENVLKDVSDNDLIRQVGKDANTISWLIWHLTRVIDDHISDLAKVDQIWVADGWAKKFDLPFSDHATGYGQSADEVVQVKASAGNLLGYFNDTFEMATSYINTLEEKDYDEVIDENWNPPVTRGVRLVSVLSDCLQHVGQAAFIKGLSK